MRKDALETASRLRTSLARLNRRLRVQSRTAGLSTRKHSILGQLYRDGPMTPSAIALAEGVQPQSITRVLAELEEANLVLRRQSEADRRQFQLEITLAGRELMVKDARRRGAWLSAAMENQLSAIERDLLGLSIPLLEKLAEFSSGEEEKTAIQQI